MVACQTCKKLYHRKCVGVDESVVKALWSCAECLIKRPRETVTVTPKLKRTPPTETSSADTSRMLVQAEKLRKLQAEKGELEKQFNNQREELERKNAEAAEEKRLHAIELKNLTELLRQANGANPPGPAANATTVIQEQRREASPIEVNPLISPSQSNTSSVSTPTSHRSALRVNIPINQLSAESISAAIVQRLAGLIPDMVRDMLPKHPQSAPAPASSDSLRNRSQYNEFFDSEDRESQSSAVHKLASTMQRSHITRLPKFNGDVKLWAYFEHVYNTTTIEGNFSEIENVNRLRDALQPPAIDVVRSLIMFSSNATTIMNELRATYGRPDMLNVALMKDLLALPSLIADKRPDLLRAFSVEIRSYVANMTSVGKASQLSNDFAMAQLSAKLAPVHQREWEAIKVKNPAAHLGTFSTFLAEKVKEIPPCLDFKETATVASTNSSNAPKRRQVLAHQQVPAQTSRGEGSHEACFKCSNSHPLYRCSEFMAMSARERSKFVYDNQICSSCLTSSKHRWRDCPRKRSCNIQNCAKFHNRALHNSFQTPQVSNNKRHEGDKTNSSRSDQHQRRTGEQSSSNSQFGRTDAFKPPTAEASEQIPRVNNHATREPTSYEDLQSPNPHFTHRDASSILFKILPVRIHGEGANFVDTFAFLDDGSSLTLMDRQIFEKLNLSGAAEPLHLQWTKGITRTEDSFRTTIAISGSGEKKRHVLTNVYAVDELDLPEQTVNAQRLKERYSHLRGLPIPDIVRGKPKILIGLQHSQLLLGSRNHVGEKDAPIASKTNLGWIVFGNVFQSMGVVALTNHKKSGVQLSIHEATKNDDELHRLVKSFFTTESFGVTPPTRDLISVENERALNIMKRTMKKVNDRYEIGLLWKADNISLPDSYSMAMNRLISAERSLLKTPELLMWKNNHVKELLAKGYARKATEEELQKSWPRVWYCPTFVIVNPNKVPPKPRDVADVAATARGESLNSNLLKGPDNLSPLLSGLFKLRENAIAVNADVKEMFHQIKIIEEDQQCQRFLWRDAQTTQPPTIYVMERMMFGPTCSPASAQYVKNCHADQFEKEAPEAVAALTKCTYVDDYFNSHSSVEAALNVTLDAMRICSSMGFDLRGAQSNNAELLKLLPKDKVKSSLVAIDAQDSDSHVAKVLGMFWQPVPDYFTFKMHKNDLVDKMLSSNFSPSKREILRTLMKIFDPLGLIAHYLIRGKIVLQEIWREGTGWDEPIPASLLPSWQEFVRELHNIDMVRIARHYAPVTPSKSHVELIVFVDASEQAFAATAYFRFSNDDNVHVAHVMGKAKVAPIKKLTIPQLELQAALLGVRLAATIKKLHQFEVHETKFLSDSKVVLAWICSRKYNFKTFVAARIGEILDTSSKRDWFHVGSKDNVADDATKWTDPSMGDYSTRWFKGPEFLQLPFALWPIVPATANTEDDETKQLTQLMLHQPFAKVISSTSAIDDIKAEFKSRWTSLSRVTAYLLRIKNRLQKKEIPRELYITPSEFYLAEELLFKRIQFDAFPEELHSLASANEDHQRSVSRSSKLLKLSPIFKDGVIRMSSRAQKANISYAARNPVILPNKHPLVDALVIHYHEKNFHLGENLTISDIRERAWIIDIRSAVQRVKRNCQHCKNRRAKPVMPLMGELPFHRVDFGVKPFTHVGLDAFGPYAVKFGRGSIKRYGLIFTCLTYRAVHIEVLNDMSTDQCIMSIRRFLVRRGWSRAFYSDNGTNFVGSKNLLHQDMKIMTDALGAATSKQFGIRWHFQPAYSPWWGGAWERLIGSIKQCVDFLMHEETPREDVFKNAIIEAEFWMNRRPLTHAPIDHEDAKPLTPNAVLFGDDQEELATMIGIFCVNDGHSAKAYRRAQHLVNKFLHRWVKEYLPTINRRSKWYERTRPLQVGDIVILTDPTQPKAAWHKGRIIKLYPGADGVSRAADVQLADKSIKRNRSTGRIAVLDIKSETSQ